MLSFFFLLSMTMAGIITLQPSIYLLLPYTSTKYGHPNCTRPYARCLLKNTAGKKRKLPFFRCSPSFSPFPMMLSPFSDQINITIRITFLLQSKIALKLMSEVLLHDEGSIDFLIIQVSNRDVVHI